MRAARTVFLLRGARSGLTVICGVETRTLKYHSRTTTDQSAYLLIALRAFLKRFIGYLLKDFKDFIETHKDEIQALSIFYSQPYRRREITYKMIKEVFEILKERKPALAPLRVWEAYTHLETVSESPKNELTALVGLIRRIVGIDKELTDYDTIARRNFRDWVVHAQAGHKHFSKDQMEWLYMMRDYIATSFHIEQDDFSLSPFGERGGLGKLHELFGDQTEKLINELNEVLVA